MTTATYETDFYLWTQQQADLLRQGEFNRVDLDLENIAEEIESMGKREPHSLEQLPVTMSSCTCSNGAISQNGAEPVGACPSATGGARFKQLT